MSGRYSVEGPWLAVVAVWAAAAGQAGAYAPRHIAAVLWEEPATPLDLAVVQGLARAADEGGMPVPRGCSVEHEIVGGSGEDAGRVLAASIVWRTSVETRLDRPRRVGGELIGVAWIPDHDARLAAARETAALHGLSIVDRGAS